VSVSDFQLRIDHLSKSYKRQDGTPVRAVDDISVEVSKGDFLVLLGPSGCGKTTLLRCVAGLERPTQGKIFLGDRLILDTASGVEIPPEKRRVGMVFQSYALWPHMTVEENITYPLRMRGASKDVQHSKVRRVLDMMRITDIAEQHPGQISGGQQQRVALARALACGDELILFDEPLSNVDAKVREHLRLELLRMQRELGFTALYVTHDQEEAMALATKIAVLGNGRIAQLGTPQDIYFRPLSLYVGRFIGSANQIDGHLTKQSDSAVIDTPLGRIRVPTRCIAAKGSHVTVLSRPEHWSLTSAPNQNDLCFEAKVRASAFVGSHNEYLVEVSGVELQIWTLGQQLLQAGSKMWCSIPTESLVVLDRG